MSEDIGANIESVRRRIDAACGRVGRKSEEITIVAVTKTIGPEDIQAAFRHGIRHYGENRVQEAAQKLPFLREKTAGSVWRMVGHLQTNKARQAADLFDTMDSVDSERVAQALSRYARGAIPVLIEVNVAAEGTKHGVRPEGLASLAERVRSMPNLEMEGLMTVAPAAGSPAAVRPVFRRLKVLADSLGLAMLSMGMSDDFEVAIEEGATMVRIGRAIFGER